MEACFELLEETSGPDYQASVGGWHPSAKREEMESPDLRYILVKVKGASSEGESIQGFASLMPTFEDGKPVIYCYEMQLRPTVQGFVVLPQLTVSHFFLLTGGVCLVEQ